MISNEKKKALVYEAKLELARRDLFYYCHLRDSSFYRPDREYQIILCKTLQDFLVDKDHDILIINAPPRFGKSRTAQLSAEWFFGHNIKFKIMTGSYNEILATQFSKGVRNSISEEKADKNKIVYSDIFPDVRIKPGDAAINLWSLEGGYNNYLATSPMGTATGFGADLLIIDDLIKSAYEANNANILEKHWQWFTNTMLSRLEGDGKIIAIMTRWSTKDLSGRILEEMPQLGYRVKQITFKAMQDDGTMLCDGVLNKEQFTKKFNVMDRNTALANYQQEPIDEVGRLYSQFKEYEENERYNRYPNYAYVDTADLGGDYLCCIIFKVISSEIYIQDVYYTQEPMEVTEIEVAKRLSDYAVTEYWIEANAGGRGFARQVDSITKSQFGNIKSILHTFTQTKNKESRILTNASWINEHVYYPINWQNRYKDFYSSMFDYQRDGQNMHDDAQDCLTGCAELVISNTINQVSFKAVEKAINKLSRFNI